MVVKHFIVELNQEIRVKTKKAKLNYRWMQKIDFGLRT